MLKEFLEKYQEVAAATGPEAQALLGFTPGMPAAGLDTLLHKDGHWFVLFLGSNRYSRYGLRIMPGKSWREWPLVKSSVYHAYCTIGPNIKHMLPFILLDRLGADFGMASELAAQAGPLAEVARPLAQLLGDEDGVAYFSQFVKNIAEQGEQAPEQANQLTDQFWSHFDTSAEHRLMRDSITKMLADKKYFPVLDTGHDYGIWQTRLYRLMYTREDGNEWQMTDAMYRNHFDEPHCFDPEYSEVAQAGNFGLYPPRLLSYACYDKKGLNRDPLSLPRSIIYKGRFTGYRGKEHLEAAGLLGKYFGSPVREWNALVNAAYWSGRNTAAALPEALAQARALCAASGWSDALYVLECQTEVPAAVTK